MGRIGVLLGGSSEERRVSLRSGAALLAAYQRLGYPVMAIDTQLGRELPKVLLENSIETAIIALHGSMGEDGTVQGLLEFLGIPYSGSSVAASALCMNKALSKHLFRDNEISTPPWLEVCVNIGQIVDLDDISLAGPFFIKPLQAGSSVGIQKVANHADLASALDSTALAVGKPGERVDILVEQEVVGAEVTLTVLDGEPLPLIEICPKKGFYDYRSKYSPGQTRYLIPAETLSKKEMEAATEVGLAAGRLLGCRGLYRVDMMVDSDGRAWVLEINTVPGLTETSLAPMAALASGLTFDGLAKRILMGVALNNQGA